MSKRQVQTPGEVAASPAEAVAAVTGAASGDDLAAFEGDKLPPASEPTAAQLAAQVRALEARLEKREAKPGPKTEPEMLTVEEARKRQQAMVKQGLRPRAMLTTEGWLTHPEMARVADQAQN